MKKPILLNSIIALLMISFGALVELALGPAVFLFFTFLAAFVFIAVAFRFGYFTLFCFVLAFLPFSRGLFQFEIGIITFNPYAFGILGLSLVCLYRILVKRQEYGLRPVDLAILLLCFSYLVSTLYAPNIVTSGYTGFNALFIPVTSYFVIKTMAVTEKLYKKAMVALICGITIFSFFGIYSFFQTYQRTSVLNVPYISSATLLFTALIYLFFTGWWKKWYGLLASISIFTALIATFARVYLVTLLFSAFVYKINQRGKGYKLFFTWLFLGLFGTLILTSYVSESSSGVFHAKEGDQTFQRVIDPQYWGTSIVQRALLYKGGIDTFLKNPLFGIGFYRDDSGQMGLGLGVSARHSIHVEWLEMGGIIGWLLYSSVFLFHFLRVSKKAPEDKLCAINLTIIFLVFCNALNNSFSTGMNPYIVFILMGFNEARLNMKFAAEEPSKSLKKFQATPLVFNLPGPQKEVLS